jgi:hypothetical protein
MASRGASQYTKGTHTMTHTYTIEKHYIYDDKTGSDKHDGWDLFDNGNWGNWYWLKRDAVAAMREAIEADKQASK